MANEHSLTGQEFTCLAILGKYKMEDPNCQAQQKPNPKLSSAEIALLTQLWGTIIHHTPPTIHPPGKVVLRSYRARANLVGIVGCSRQPQHKLATQKLVGS